MNRKSFLSSLMAGGLSLPPWTKLPAEDPGEDKKTVVPRYLKPGDTIGITCPSGFITPAEVQPAVQLMESWGFKTRLGATVGQRDFTYGGTDEERRADFQQMLDDNSVKAIMCARGGYGAIRIVDALDFNRFAAKPKWIIGFSDITVFHSHLNRNYGIASIHSKMCNSFPAEWSEAEPGQAASILSIKQALLGEKMQYTAAADDKNKPGAGEGILVGGNLKTLESLSGSRSDIQTAGKILFVEDTGEYLYSIDRMFWNLKRTNKLGALKGLVIGGFKIKPDDTGEEFGKTVQEIVLEKIKNQSYPVCFNFPVGHQKDNFALKCGVRHRLKVTDHDCSLTEIR